MTVPVPIAVMDGDDIGPEIVGETVKVLDAAAARHGFSIGWQPLPGRGQRAGRVREHAARAHTSRAAAGYSGLDPRSRCRTCDYPIGDPRYVNPSGYLRKNFELYSNVRPARGWPGVEALHPT